jgi:tetrahydromethanopterin S-methyltransferase subunit C
MTVTTGKHASVQTHANGDASFGELASRLSEQVSRLVHDELTLAQLEAKRKAKSMGLGIGMFGASGIIALFGAGVAIAAAVLGLANVLSAWLAAIIVAAALFVLAGIIAIIGRTSVKHGSPPIPADAIESTKADVAAVRQAVRR